MGEYVGALERLIGDSRSLGLLGAPRTAYLGGGTPTLLGADLLGTLISSVCRQGIVEELSFEANPESLADNVISAAARSGATRISIGAQSFIDRELKALGRIHTSLHARERVIAAVESGLDVSLDLMCGIPYQTDQTWRRSLEEAVDLGVSHISCYPLMIEEGTAMERLCDAGKLPWPDDDVEADYMQTASRVLSEAGFSRYEVASYASPLKSCRHNITYWTGGEYLGLGTSASSMLCRESYLTLGSAVPSLPAPQGDSVRFRLTITSSANDIARSKTLADLCFDVEQLNAREVAAEDLMLGMRMSKGISKDLISVASEYIPIDGLRVAIGDALHEGLASWDAQDHLVPTTRGWLMGNELYGLFWDLA